MAQATATHPLAPWLWLPWKVGVGFLLSGLVSWIVLGSVLDWPTPSVGFVAAVAVVTAYSCAPSHRLAAAIISFIVGAAAAYVLLRHTSFPENHPRAYEHTFIPLWVTLSGGVVALLACVVHAWRSVPSNTSLERTRGR